MTFAVWLSAMSLSKISTRSFELTITPAPGGTELTAADERKYQKLREELTAEVESVQFHNAKIEYLVDQLYSYNRRLTALGGVSAAAAGTMNSLWRVLFAALLG